MFSYAQHLETAYYNLFHNLIWEYIKTTSELVAL